MFERIRLWALLVTAVVAALIVALAALFAWMVLTWTTTGASARSDIAELLGAALGASLTVLLTLSVATSSASRLRRDARKLLLRTVRGLQVDAEHLNDDNYPGDMEDSEALQLCRQLARRCERLREGLRILESVMSRQIDQDYDVLADIFRVRRSLEWLTEPTHRNKGVPPLVEVRDHFEVGEGVFHFYNTLRAASNITVGLRQRLRDLLGSLEAAELASRSYAFFIRSQTKPARRVQPRRSHGSS